MIASPPSPLHQVLHLWSLHYQFLQLLALKNPLRRTTSPLRLKPVSGLALLPGTPAESSASSASPAVSGQSVLGHPTTLAHPSAVSAARDPPALSHRPAVPSIASYEQDMSRWNCSHQQRIWMKTEMGLWPGSRPLRHPVNMISLWRNPPQPELIDSIYELPSPKYFQLHPFFIWKPEHAIMERVRNNYSLPCLYNCSNPHVVSSGVGRPRVVLGASGQYYILASRLSCRVCKKFWFADKPQWVNIAAKQIPQHFSSISDPQERHMQDRDG
nr:uncharacterized protein LOC129164453 [Nothobranchius furzeri]